MNEELLFTRILTIVSLAITLVALLVLYNYDKGTRSQPASAYASAQYLCVTESIRLAPKPLRCETVQSILQQCDPLLLVGGMCDYPFN